MSRAALAFAATGAFALAGCASEDHFGTECSATATITFRGRAYTDGFEASSKGGEVEKGRRLGSGRTVPSCNDLDGKGERLEVFKVVGVPVARAVYVDPPFGAMGRDTGES